MKAVRSEYRRATKDAADDVVEARGLQAMIDALAVALYSSQA